MTGYSTKMKCLLLTKNGYHCNSFIIRPIIAVRIYLYLNRYGGTVVDLVNYISYCFIHKLVTCPIFLLYRFHHHK